MKTAIHLIAIIGLICVCNMFGFNWDAFSQQQTECPPECVTDSMEIVTWYPSPYSEYEELRLYPKVSAAQ